ncbi:MAG TPA: hypothetical protein VN767_19275 [Streptosporangiaceae bacterium]|jgi:hypothetical protein|nr:hypothetical protein [Streptosporangiaceae bacterium]
MPLRVRKRELSLVLCGFAASFGITLSTVAVVRHHDASASGQIGSGQVETPTPTFLGPAALDDQWVNYSDQSTCADRAGGDGVSAVRLSPSQIAWFFSDSSLGPAGPDIGLSEESGFVHNLVVMQTMSPTQNKLVTATGGAACTSPDQPSHALPVISSQNAGGRPHERYWGGDGLRVGSDVLHFYTGYRPGAFIPVNTVIADFPVGQLAAAGRGPAYGAVLDPRITNLPNYVPHRGGTPIVWGAALLRQGNTVYIYGWQSPSKKSSQHDCYLAKAPLSRLVDMTEWRFYAGNGVWAASQAAARPITAGVSHTVDTAFSVTKAAGRYWLIEHTSALGSANIDAFPAPAPWGPFNPADGIVLYHATDIGLTAADRYQIMYEARVEPALSTRQTLTISYNVNTLAVSAGCVPLSDYTNTVPQPRFIAVPRSDFKAGPGLAKTVIVGPPAYSASRPEPPWYDSWSYPGGCPPLSTPRGFSVKHRAHSVTLAWHSVGSGVRYQVYLRPAAGRYRLVRTARSPLVTLGGLTRGRQYSALIIPENFRHKAGPAAIWTFTAG